MPGADTRKVQKKMKKKVVKDTRRAGTGKGGDSSGAAEYSFEEDFAY